MEWNRVCRRAGGRRGYNRRRQLVAQQRRAAIAERLTIVGWSHGIQRRLAGEFSVSEATLSRDIKHILALARPITFGICEHLRGPPESCALMFNRLVA